MTALIDLPELQSRKPAASSHVLPEPDVNEPGPRQEPGRPSLFATLLRAAILLTFAGGALALIGFSLVPAVFLAMVLFLPALAPFILVGLCILFAEDAERSRDRRQAELEQPCSCHHDRMKRAMQLG